MTGWLAREAFASDVEGFFLMARSDREAQMYAKAGFVSRSEVLHISQS
jgi:hypothetical protein